VKVLVTGGTGFTGSYVVPEILKGKSRVRCLVRPGSEVSRLPADDVEIWRGNLDNESDIDHCLEGIDIFVNIASLGFGHASSLVRVLEKHGITRAIFISTTAIFTQLNSSSKSIRVSAEELIRSSNLNYTILRPTMIYGNGRDRNMCRLIKYVRKMPLIPIFGSGEYLQQPVYVKDVASAVSDVLENERTYRKEYNIGGAQALTYNAVIDTVADLLGKKIRKVHIPSQPIIKGLHVIEKTSITLPLKAEQIQRLNEHKAFDYYDAARDFGYEPLTFRDGIMLELKAMNIL
jgi:nucleoside-diphosphate-sugar epimerase